MKARITGYIADTLLSGRVAGGISGTDDLLGSGLVDSLGVMQLVAFLEGEFALEIPAEDVVIEHFQSVDLICAYLKRRLPSA